MAVYAAEVTEEESDMANDAEPDMNETTESDNASEPDKEDKTDRFIYDNSFKWGFVWRCFGNRKQRYGKKIVNYKNELNTDIELERAGDCIKFNLNDGEYLCGEVTLHIDDVKGKYLYLYNNVKHKYELVSTKDMSVLNLSTPVKYMITAKPIREGGTAVRYILIAGGIGIIAGIAVYVYKAINI